MSILSNTTERTLSDDFNVSVRLSDSRVNFPHINIQELGITHETSKQQLIFNITYRLLNLFEGMPVSVLDDDVLQKTVSRILNCPGYVCIDKDRLASTILITYYRKEERCDAEVLIISLDYKEWVC